MPASDARIRDLCLVAGGAASAVLVSHVLPALFKVSMTDSSEAVPKEVILEGDLTMSLNNLTPLATHARDAMQRWRGESRRPPLPGGSSKEVKTR